MLSVSMLTSLEEAWLHICIPLENACHCSTSWRSKLGNGAAGMGYKSCTYQSPISQRWLIGDRPGSGWPVKSVDMTSLQRVPCHIAGIGHCPAGRENGFQQSDRLTGHAGEGLHPHSVGQKVCPE